MKDNTKERRMRRQSLQKVAKAKYPGREMRWQDGVLRFFSAVSGFGGPVPGVESVIKPEREGRSGSWSRTNYSESGSLGW